MAALMASNELNWHIFPVKLGALLGDQQFGPNHCLPACLPIMYYYLYQSRAGKTWRGRHCGLVCCGEMVYKKLGSKEMKTSTCSFVINIQSFSPAEPQRWCTSENNRTLKLSRVLDWRWRWFRYFISEITEREMGVDEIKKPSDAPVTRVGHTSLNIFSNIFNTFSNIFRIFWNIFIRTERWEMMRTRSHQMPGGARLGQIRSHFAPVPGAGIDVTNVEPRNGTGWTTSVISTLCTLQIFPVFI